MVHCLITDKENTFFVVIVQIYFLLIIITKTPNLIGGQVVHFCLTTYTSHNSKAFTNGVFFPLILQNGRATGNWKMTLTRRNIAVNTSYFDNDTPTNLSAAEEKARLQLISFHN